MYTIFFGFATVALFIGACVHPCTETIGGCIVAALLTVGSLFDHDFG